MTSKATAQYKDRTGAGDRACVLVIDRDDCVASTLGEIFGDRIEAKTVATYAQAVSLLEASPSCDLAFINTRLEPDRLRDWLIEIHRRAPLAVPVLLTEPATAAAAVMASQFGACEILLVPCSAVDLKRAFERGLERRRGLLAERENHDLRQVVAEQAAEIAQLRQALAAANRVRDSFFSTLSHDLRAPLTPVLVWTGLLRSGNLDERMVAKALDTIERNARLQSRMIDDLLDYSRLLTGRMQFDMELIDLNEAVQAAVEMLRGEAAAREISLDVKLSSAPLIVLGSLARLQQIVRHLLSNSIKFSESGARVGVRVGAQDKEAQVVVEDAGAGIEASLLPHIFDLPEKGWPGERQRGGLGLGLAIARALAEGHGGRLRAESEGAGRGARFTFTMPCAMAPRTEPSKGDGHKAAAEIRPPILIVEDSPETLELMRMLLARAGCRVMTAGSGIEALKMVVAEKPGLIISDVDMPGMDGYSMLSQLRRLPGMEEIPALAVSGYTTEEDRARALAAGFSAHLGKPIDPRELLALIRKLAHE
jgi:signal transduction histidine kinase